MSTISHCIPKFLSFFIFLLLQHEPTKALVLRSYISQHGLHGEIEFTLKNDSLITIRTNLQPTLEYPDQVWRWSVREFPVDYRITGDERCSEANLGKELLDLTEELGYLVIPGKDHAEYESKRSLTGPNGLWGKSLVFETAERDRIICASILSTESKYETLAAARFTSSVAGSLNFRWILAEEFDETDSYIEAELYHTKPIYTKVPFTEHKWKLFVTDVFDSDKGNHEDNCNVLQLVFDPENSGDGMKVGDLDSRLGKIKITTEPQKQRMKILYKNDVINVLKKDMDVTRRSLYVVIHDDRDENIFLACAKLRPVEAKRVQAMINMDGINGSVILNQRSHNDPTWIDFNLGASDLEYESDLRFVSSMQTYSIHELPPKISASGTADFVCNTTGMVYNPRGISSSAVPPPGLGTQDQYPIGDLLGKLKGRTDYLNHKYLLPGLANELSGLYWDVFLPLQGRHSVFHRALVLERRPPKRNICATLLMYDAKTGYQTRMTSAEVIFRYPIVGKVVLRQPRDRPWEDTTVIIESMVHADGSSVNNTRDHRWSLHEKAPGKDFYNWTARCLSAGAEIGNRSPGGGQLCSDELSGLCALGDLTARHGTLQVAGKKIDSANLTRRLFTDVQIPLAGKRSVMKRSLVIYDDHGPVARGERMACSIISGLNPRKAVAHEWFGEGLQSEVRGKMEVTQQSPYELADLQLSLEHLDDVVNYKIHEAPVEQDLEFPCERSSVLDTFNPFHVDKTKSPPPTKGTVDQYELGALGDKFGLLRDLSSMTGSFNDSQMSLFGTRSVLGRSLVIHKQVRDRHWACSSIERGYSPSEARELRAIASFHHPAGFARGYIRFTQLIHNDGSASDTVIEVKLSHPGDRNTNLTRNHRWEVYVNPVGVDAAVQVTATRCVAGGYRWNPFFTQLADPLNRDLYDQECGEDNPLRCEVGDLTSRLGTIDMGGNRQVFSDSNLPLEGIVTAIGRSIVVFGPERSGERHACANIEPDNDIIKYVNVMKPPRFVLGQFLSEMRSTLGAPAWMLRVDSRRTKTLHKGACLQLLLHFTGPQANQLELDFTKLLASGRLDSASIFIPGFINTKRKTTTSYRPCGVSDPNEGKKNKFFFSASSAHRHKISLVTLFTIIIYLFL